MGTWPLVVVAASVVSGFSLEARAEEASGAPEQSQKSIDDEHKRHGSVFVDPLGFALFGPRVGVEGGSGHFSGALHGRWFNAGLLAHQLFLNQDDSFGASFGVGLRGRYYLGPQLDRLHLGVAAEYLRVSVENQSSLIVSSSTYLVPYAEVGYRLTFGDFYGDGSLGLGYAARLSGTVENLPGGSSASLYEARDESSAYGTASLDFGWLF
jgi:hypothetical protein